MTELKCRVALVDYSNEVYVAFFQDSPYGRKILRVSGKTQTGRTVYSLEEYTPGDDPTFTFQYSDFKALVEEGMKVLATNGWKPADKSYVEGKLAGVEAHLSDLQILLMLKEGPCKREEGTLETNVEGK